MSSLKDQLFAAGLTDKQSLKNARKQKQPKLAKKARGELSETTKLAEQARLEKAQRDKALNRQLQLAAQKKAEFAQIKQLVESSKIDRNAGEIAYSFTIDNKIKNIYVTAEQQKQLARGQICIVALNNGSFELVPKVVAQKIGQRQGNYIIQNTTLNEVIASEDDPYAAYQIPDDLMW